MKSPSFFRGYSVIVLALVAYGCGGSGGKGGTRSGGDVCNRPDAPSYCGEGCINDDGCGAGTYCANQECTADCTAIGDDCAPEQVCSNEGRCVARDPGACDDAIPPVSCGTSCDISADCGAGAYCFQHQCTADCVPDDANCEADFFCNDSGQCEADPVNCDPINIQPTRKIPNVILIIDRSGSMAWDFENDASGDPTFNADKVKLDAIKKALIGDEMIPGLVAQLQPNVAFGLSAYGEGYVYTPGTRRPRTPGVCAAHANTVLPPATDNGTALTSKIDGLIADGGTPTAQTIKEVTDYVVANPTIGGKTVYVLATDGLPNGCYTVPATTNPVTPGVDHEHSGEQDSISEVERARALQISTFVVGIAPGSGTFSDHLIALARAGAGGDINATPYNADSPAGLTTALETVLFGQIPCTVTLDHEIIVADACQATVELNSEELTCNNATRGWRANSGTEIELLGTACTEWQRDNDPILAISAPCGIIVPG